MAPPDKKTSFGKRESIDSFMRAERAGRSDGCQCELQGEKGTGSGDD